MDRMKTEREALLVRAEHDSMTKQGENYISTSFFINRVALQAVKSSTRPKWKKLYGHGIVKVRAFSEEGAGFVVGSGQTLRTDTMHQLVFRFIFSLLCMHRMTHSFLQFKGYQFEFPAVLQQLSACQWYWSTLPFIRKELSAFLSSNNFTKWNTLNCNLYTWILLLQLEPGSRAEDVFLLFSFLLPMHSSKLIHDR